MARLRCAQYALRWEEERGKKGDRGKGNASWIKASGHGASGDTQCCKCPLHVRSVWNESRECVCVCVCGKRGRGGRKGRETRERPEWRRDESREKAKKFSVVTLWVSGESTSGDTYVRMCGVRQERGGEEEEEEKKEENARVGDLKRVAKVCGKTTSGDA